MSNIDEKLGYLTGVMEGVKDDISEGREEVKDAFRKIHHSFADHSDSDDRRFKELGEELREVRDVQKKVKWWLTGSVATLSLIISTVVYAMKLFKIG